MHSERIPRPALSSLRTECGTAGLALGHELGPNGERITIKKLPYISLEAYMQQAWDGDLLELMAGNLYSYGMSYLMHLDNRSLDTAGFFEKVTSCDRECIDCDFCGQLAAKLVKRGVFTPEKIKDMGLSSIDPH